MKTDERDNFVIISDKKDEINDFVSYLERIVPKTYEAENLIIDLLKYSSLKLPQLLLFLKLSNYHRSTKHSFVIVNDAINPDDIPFEMTVVPTVQEAKDIIEMEEIERDLGF